ncbi:MAG: hypothetical protein ABI821_07860 [Pseudomonadota bacterium]
MIIATLITIAGLVYVVLGTLHGLYTWLDTRNARRIVPDDPAVITAMQNSKIRLTRGAATMWQGWVGFNFSHSVGAVFFGGTLCSIAASLGRLSLSPWVLLVLAGLSGMYLLLALKYWFRVPVLGTAIATTCLVLAWLIYL